MRALFVALVFAATACSAGYHRGDCEGGRVCVTVVERGDDLDLSVINLSDKPVYVPWINGVSSVYSGFRVSAVDTVAVSEAPSVIEFEAPGIAMLVPGAFYGVRVGKESLASSYGLAGGCHNLIFEYNSELSEVHGDVELTRKIKSEALEVCL